MSLERRRQTAEEILSSLQALESNWKDAHAESVLALISSVAENIQNNAENIRELLCLGDDQISLNKANLDHRLTTIRLFLDCSKDQFISEFKALSEGKGPCVTFLRAAPSEFIDILMRLGLAEKMNLVMSRKYSWRDILEERLKGGRGSAIQGQQRGRNLEDFIQSILEEVYGLNGFDSRCQFLGANGTSKEKADFAIPSKDDPEVLIEAKAYGATGSKQTDVIGDVNRIISEKRNDTHFFLITDGVTWRERTSDLKKLVDLQNKGQIARIYTQAMRVQILKDLRSLK